MKKLVALLFVVGLLWAPASFAAGGSPVTKSAYGGHGSKPQAIVAGVTASDDSLPFTGADLGIFVVAGVALVGMGFGLRRISRRSDQ